MGWNFKIEGLKYKRWKCLLLAKTVICKKFVYFWSSKLLLQLSFPWKSWQGVCNCICFTLAVVNKKMILQKLLCPLYLMKAQTLGIYKFLKVVVIYKHKHFLLTILQVMPPYLKSFNNSKKLIVVGLVSSFCKNHFLNIIGFRVPDFTCQLTKSTLNSITKFVCFKANVELTV